MWKATYYTHIIKGIILSKISKATSTALETVEVKHDLEGLEFVEVENHFFVTTKSISEVFGKRHADILRSVGNLLQSPQCGDWERKRKIGLTLYQIENPSKKGNFIDKKMYLLDRDK